MPLTRIRTAMVALTPTLRMKKAAMALAAAGGLALSMPASTAHAAAGDRVIWTNGNYDIQFAAGECVADGYFRYTTAHSHPNTMHASITKVSGPAWCRFAIDMTYRDQYNRYVSYGEQVTNSAAYINALGTRCSVRVSIQRPGDGWFTQYLTAISPC
ncbi:hypothetical protein ACFC58_29120 [Kitasatospora purpeofusca]|uniref:hypothetical protein n=1 Tax=Kitasatospora purpeofusca TaxID=67352 RepID=UPI0035D7F048